LSLGKTVGELEGVLTYRELQTWNEFYLDRQDEAPRQTGPRKMYRREDGPPPKPLEQMNKEEIARMFGAKVV
jgi:hypothetical protein